MTILLYDLCGANDARFSPYCWRVKMALAHKGLPFETRPVPFTEIPRIEGGGQTTVPVIRDGDKVIRESFDIALHLEAAYPDRPSLFAGPGGVAGARFIESWTNAVVHPGLVRLILADIHARVEPADEAYFRSSRETRFGMPLAEVQKGREERVAAFRDSLAPLRVTLARQPFLGGEGPLYHDHVVFGPLQWARVASPFRVLAEDDPVAAWFARCLALHDGFGAKEPAAAT